MTKNAATNTAAPRTTASPELRAAIAQFCRRRSIEAATALSVIALTSFSQAWALSVSELNVESSLGQPLRATLDISTSTGELINARCLRLSSAKDPGIPAISGVTLAVSSRLNGATVRFSGSKPLREPMSEMILNVDCSGTPVLSKSFLVMLDPPSLNAPVANPAAVVTQPNVAVRTRAGARPSSAIRQRGAARTTSRAPIEPGTNYVVQPGDILSVIASRVAGRPDYSVWPIAQRIYDTNSSAFDSQEPDSLRVGATLRIPALSGRLAVAGTINQTREIQTRAERSRPQRASAATRPDRVRAAPTTIERRAEPVRGRNAPTVLARAIVPRQPVVKRMAYARDLSRLSIDRLRQRRAGNPFVVNLAANEAPPAPQPQPLQDAPAVVAPKLNESAAATLPVTTPVATSSTSRISWLISGVALLLGALIGTVVTGFGLRRWLATQKAEQEVEISRAKRHQARLDESRQKRTDKSAPSIVVHEELPRVDISRPPVMDAIGSVEEVVAAGASSAAIGALLEQDAAAEPIDELSIDSSTDSNTDSRHDAPDLSVDSIEPEADLNYDVFEAPDDEDLELLARDYAASIPDLGELEPDVDFGETQALLSPEKLGMVPNATEIIASPLDLELPVGYDDETELSVAALREASVNANADGNVHDLEHELTEAVIQLDTELLELAQSLPRDDDPTAEAQRLELDEGDQDNDPTTAIPTRDSEEFYHLEASSIRKVDSLSFEEELDDDDTQLVSVSK